MLSKVCNYTKYLNYTTHSSVYFKFTARWRQCWEVWLCEYNTI